MENASSLMAAYELHQLQSELSNIESEMLKANKNFSGRKKQLSIYTERVEKLEKESNECRLVERLKLINEELLDLTKKIAESKTRIAELEKVIEALNIRKNSVVKKIDNLRRKPLELLAKYNRKMDVKTLSPATLAYAARAVYDSDEFSVDGVTYTSIYTAIANGTRVKVYQGTNDTSIVAFRGSETAGDAVKDIALAIRPEIFKIFIDIEELTTSALCAAIQRDGTIFCTGHSLGGVYSQVFSAQFGVPGMAFNSPGAPFSFRKKTFGVFFAQLLRNRQGDCTFTVHNMEYDLVSELHQSHCLGGSVLHRREPSRGRDPLGNPIATSIQDISNAHSCLELAKHLEKNQCNGHRCNVKQTLEGGIKETLMSPLTATTTLLTTAWGGGAQVVDGVTSGDIHAVADGVVSIVTAPITAVSSTLRKIFG